MGCSGPVVRIRIGMAYIPALATHRQESTARGADVGAATPQYHRSIRAYSPDLCSSSRSTQTTLRLGLTVTACALAPPGLHRAASRRARPKIAGCGACLMRGGLGTLHWGSGGGARWAPTHHLGPQSSAPAWMAAREPFLAHRGVASSVPRRRNAR